MSTALGTLAVVNRRLVAGAAFISALAIGVIALAIVVEVVRRGAGLGSVPGLLEFSESLLVGAVFLAMANAERMEAHVRVEVVTSRLGPRKATIFRMVGMGVSLVMCGLFAYYGTRIAIQSYVTDEARYGLLHFPLWPARFVIVVGFWLVTVQYLIKFALYVGALRNRRYFRYSRGRRTDFDSRTPHDPSVSV